MDEMKIFRNMLDKSSRIVFFGGAGVSTESGIPDFRSADGLYNQTYRYPPEVILSHDFFMSHTEEFYEFYRAKMLAADAKPNAAHKKLAELEQIGKLTAVITQNIDGLHQKAGSNHVLELHGSVYRNFCMDCGEKYSIEEVAKVKGVPHCRKCNGIIKPDVVLYGEALNAETIEEAVQKIAEADMLIVGGTSLDVYPAAGLIDYYTGERLVLINQSPTQYDKKADLLIKEKIGTVFSAI